MSLGTLIIGLGQIGMRYDLGLNPDTHVYSHARAFKVHPAFHLLGGVDPDNRQRRSFEREYHCPAYTDVETALVQVQPKLIVIAVPTPFHGETLRRVLKQSRPAAVLCEKPLSYDLEEARAMVQACADESTWLFVNYMRRSVPGVIEVKRRIEAGEIAVPVKGVAWYSKGLLHNGSHFFNLLQYWLGPMVTTDLLDSGRLWNGTDPEPDVRVLFEQGKIVFLAAREEAFSHHTAELLATNGRLRCERGGEHIHWQPAVPDRHRQACTMLSPEIETIASGMDRYQWHVAEQLAAALDGRKAYLCDGTEALKTLESIKTIIDKRSI
jgi:predicted dehydrogenase